VRRISWFLIAACIALLAPVFGAAADDWPDRPIDPGPGTATTESSFAATIVNAVDTVSASS